MADTTKSVLKSKTIWLNSLTLAAAIVPGLAIPAKTGVLVLALVNIALRWITKGPVSFSGN